MKILNLKKAPSAKQLAETLKQEFSGEYSYRLFGLGSERSVIVRKSTFVGVQVSKSGNEVSVQRLLMPSLSSSIFSIIDILWTGGLLLDGVFGSPVRNLEKEVALFIKKKYG